MVGQYFYINQIYVELDDEHKIIYPAFSNEEYLGIPEMAEGDGIRLTIKHLHTGRTNLTNAEMM